MSKEGPERKVEVGPLKEIVREHKLEDEGPGVYKETGEGTEPSRVQEHRRTLYQSLSM